MLQIQMPCSTTGNRHVTLVTNFVTIHEILKEDRIVTSSQIIRTVYLSQDGNRKAFDYFNLTAKSPWLSSFKSITNLLSRTSRQKSQALEYLIN